MIHGSVGWVTRDGSIIKIVIAATVVVIAAIMTVVVVVVVTVVVVTSTHVSGNNHLYAMR